MLRGEFFTGDERLCVEGTLPMVIECWPGVDMVAVHDSFCPPHFFRFRICETLSSQCRPCANPFPVEFTYA